MLEKFLKNFILVGLFLILFIPLYIADPLFFPFITGKNFAFRIIVEIIFSAWALLVLIDKIYRPKMNAILISFASFVFIIAIANIFGENTIKAFWSNFERMEGWITLIHGLAYTVVLGNILNTEKLWIRFLNTTVFVSAILSFYGIFQLAGYLEVHQGGDRLDATLGNAIYLAVYMLFHIFITLFLIARHRGGMFLKTLYSVLIAFQVLILLYTKTRGAILGVFGGAVLTTIIIIIFEKEKIKLKKISAGFLIGLLIVGGAIFAFRDTNFIRDIPGVGRVAAITLDQTTVRSRFMVWDMAFQGFKERPILGWGQEGYNFVFNKYYNPNMHDQEAWFDRAHNTYIDWLIAGGLLGFLAYISIHLSSLYYLWRRESFSEEEIKVLSGEISKKKKKKQKEKQIEKEVEKKGRFSVIEKAIFTGLFAAYGFHAIFVFDNLVSYTLFFMVLAYIYHRVVHGFILTEEELEEEKVFQKKQDLVKKVGAPIALVMSFFLVFNLNAGAIKRANYLVYAINPVSNDFSVNFALFEKGLDQNTRIGFQEVTERMVEFTSRLPQKQIDKDALLMFFEKSEELLKKQLERVPNDARQWVFLGTLYNNFGDYEKALDAFNRAIELSPKKQNIMMQIGLIHISRKNFDEGLSWLKRAYELEPRFSDIALQYAIGAVYARRDELANDLLQKHFGSLVVDDDKLLNAYVATNQFDKAIEIMKIKVEKNPKNAQKVVALAAAYYKNGEPQKAIEKIKEAIEIDSNFKKQGESYIKKIKQGIEP